jgi:hypothetical protein
MIVEPTAVVRRSQDIALGQGEGGGDQAETDLVRLSFGVMAFGCVSMFYDIKQY